MNGGNMNLKNLEAYEILEQRAVADLDSEGAILRHKKTGARVLLLSNDDENKVFYIGFRTPPQDSTGVAHINEHSVLCGSDKYPVKDPFVELAKGSLNTFLNAMTYPDKTVYPVASCNDKDFANLCDVYLDAVFHPNIYKEKKIFEQEGWHFETDENGKLFYNGVVYNEMKGAYSSADDTLEREIMNALFPDTAYGVDSGGKPENIPDLTYEAFLDFHRRFYHPSNSYIYLYGNMDMAERLEYIDREYLSAYDRLDIDSSVKKQKPFEERRFVTKEYPILKDDDRENNYYYAYSVMAAKSLDPDFYVALDVLDYALCSAPGAPVKEALTKAGLGEDNYSSCESGILQPYFSFVSKNAKEGETQRFVSVIEDTLKDIAKKGIDKDSLLAALNLFEFKYKEADYGSYPKGLMLGLQALDSWLYDDMKPFLYIEANEIFRRLRKKADEGYFEELIKELILDNPSKVILCLKPSKTMADEASEKTAERLKQIEDSLSAEELEKIRIHSNELKEYQASEDDPEDLAKIPMLKRSDLDVKAKEFKNELIDLEDGDGVRLLWHDYSSNGVSYFRVLFDIRDLPDEDGFYLSIFKMCIGLMDTEHYTYAKLNNEINLNTGGITPQITVVADRKDTDKVKAFFEFKARCFEEKTKDAVRLVKEMLLCTDFSDSDRLLEILLEARAGIQAAMQAGGHQTAVARAMSKMIKAAWITEKLSGIDFLDRLTELTNDFDNRKEELTRKLDEVRGRIITGCKVLLDHTGKKQGRILFENCAKDLLKDIREYSVKENAVAAKEPAKPKLGDGFVKKAGNLKEAFVTSSDVCYVCRAGYYKSDDLVYSGAMKVLKVMMGYDYLWLNIRVLGGAYGCMSGFTKTGIAYFVSYRDPNLEKTLEVYENAAKYISEVDLDEDTLTKYVIGAIASQDMPLTPLQAGSRSFSAYMTGENLEDEQKERDEMIGCSVSDIRALSRHIKAFLDDGILSVNGKEDIIKGSSDLFELIRPMFR